jgi:putative ABC transport system permease protein
MVRLLQTFWQDIGYSLRAMRKKPGFAATAILTLGLAIGGNTAVFTVIRAVLLKALPYPDSDRLVGISGGATPTRFGEMKAGARTLGDIGAYTSEENLTLSGAGEPEVLKGVRVSANFLRILGINPLLGRSFRPEEDSAAGPPVVMISAMLWERRFARDPQIASRTTTLSEVPYTIIGVLPSRFSFPYQDVDLWMTAPTESPLFAGKSRNLSPFLSLFGRLKPGVSLQQATAEAKVIHQQYALAHPAMLDAKPKRPENVTAIKDGMVANVRTMLWMLLGAVGFVLLIACANVASLLLARATARSREMAVRSALGAGHLRIAGQLVSESMALSLPGGIVGMLVASWSLRLIPKITALQLPRAQEIHLDWVMFGYAAALSIGSGMFFGLVPALSSSQPDLMGSLRASGETANQGARGSMLQTFNLRGLLVVGQIALSIVLLIGTALLLESVSRLRGVAVGFNPEKVLTARISLGPLHYDTNQKRARFFQEIIRNLELAPGIRRASASMFLPMMGFAGTPVQDAAKPLLKLNERPIATVGVVTPGYFRTLEIPLRRGRDFTERDKEGEQRVAIIDEALARRLWPSYPNGQDPVGQHLWVGGANPNPAEIVGIVADVHQNLENTAWPETVYVSLAQNSQSFAMLAIRTEANPLGLAATVREQVRRIDRNQAISEVRTMAELVDEQVGERRLLSILLGCFATMALLLVLIGIYGVIAYSVVQQTQEMGIRRALGAQQSDILRLVIGQSFRLALVGAMAGVIGSFGVTRLMQSLLFRISPTDPATFMAVVVLFLCVALVASYIPARRATRIDPISALRV